MMVPACVNAMRQICARSVAHQPDKYSEAMLGKPNAEYCDWILDSRSWGGGIELAVLADFFQIELAVVSAVSKNINIFGETDNLVKRAYLLFDGVHYDALFVKPSGGGRVETVFSPMDTLTYEKVVAYATIVHDQRKFSNMTKFTLKCKQCGTLLVGETETIVHARQTGHLQFAEVRPQE